MRSEEGNEARVLRRGVAFLSAKGRLGVCPKNPVSVRSIVFHGSSQA